jgi:DNA polymerase-3 subunit epsilon
MNKGDGADLLIEPAGTGLVTYIDPEVATLRRLIDNARARLAELETELTRERHAVDAVLARLFELLRTVYERRDQLRLLVRYRRLYLDTLLQQGEEEAAQKAEQYQEAKRQTDREYEQAAKDCQRKRRELSTQEWDEIKTTWRRLVCLFHPDRYHDDPKKQTIYQQLTAEINRARDAGDLDRLREIAADPNAYLRRQGMANLNFDEDDDALRLRQLYEGLQAQILEAIANLEALRASADYELYLRSTRDPNWFEQTSVTYAEALQAEIAQLEQEAAQLADEIESLTGEKIF